MPFSKIVLLFLLLLIWACPALAASYEEVLQTSASYAQKQINNKQLWRYCAGVLADDLSDNNALALAHALRSRLHMQEGNLDQARADAEAALKLGPDIPGGYQAMLELCLADWNFDEAAAWAEQAGQRAASQEERDYFTNMLVYCQELAASSSVGAVLAAYAENPRRAHREYFEKELNLRGPVTMMRRNVLANSSRVELAAGSGRFVRCTVLTDTNDEVREVMNLKPGMEAILRGKIQGYSSGMLLVIDCRLITSR